MSNHTAPLQPAASSADQSTNPDPGKLAPLSPELQAKIDHLKQAYVKFLKKMKEIEQEEHELVNEILKEIDQVKIQKTMDKIDQIKNNAV